MCIFYTSIAGVSFIIYYVVSCISDIFLANSCLLLTVWILLDVRIACKCMLTFDINSQSSK